MVVQFIARNPREIGELELEDPRDWLGVEALMTRVRGAREAPKQRFARFKAVREALGRWGGEENVVARIWAAATGEAAQHVWDRGVVTSSLEARAVLASAFWLNAPRGSALDFLESGDDPLYASSGDAAVAKLVALFEYFGSPPDDRELRFEPLEPAPVGSGGVARFRTDESPPSGALVLAPGTVRLSGRAATLADRQVAKRPEAYVALLFENAAGVVTRGAKEVVRVDADWSVAPGTGLVADLALAPPPRDANPRSPDAVYRALDKARAVAFAARPNQILWVAGPWGASTFLDAAEPVLRVAQLAVAAAQAGRELALSTRDFAPRDAKRLRVLARALRARRADVDDLIVRMICRDADPPATFGRTLVDWLRTLPRDATPSDDAYHDHHDADPPANGTFLAGTKRSAPALAEPNQPVLHR